MRKYTIFGIFLLCTISISACIPTPTPCDPCGQATRLAVLETRVALAGSVTATMLPPSVTPTATLSATATRTATETPTIVIPTGTPTAPKTGTPAPTLGTPMPTSTVTPGLSIALSVSPPVTRPGYRVTAVLTYRGGPAEIGLWITSYTCCPVPEPAIWNVTGDTVTSATVLVNTTCPAGERTFTAYVKIGGVVVAQATASFMVDTGTPQPTPVATPTATGTPQTVLILTRYGITDIINPAGATWLWLYTLNPAAYWLQIMDGAGKIVAWGWPSARGWNRYEVGGANPVQVWNRGGQDVRVAAVKLTDTWCSERACVERLP